jgi:hypothetical protein
MVESCVVGEDGGSLPPGDCGDHAVDQAPGGDTGLPAPSVDSHGAPQPQSVTNGLDAGAWRSQNAGSASRDPITAPGKLRALADGESTLSSGAVSPAETSRPTGGSRCTSGVRQSAGLRRWWWLGALLAVASLIVGGTVVHTVDQRHARRTLYNTQLLTTASRFLDEERSQIALPLAQASRALREQSPSATDYSPRSPGDNVLRPMAGLTLIKIATCER